MSTKDLKKVNKEEERAEHQGSSRKRLHEDTTNDEASSPEIVASSPRLPKIGDLCSVFFDLGVDFFRPGKLQGELGGWYPATVENVTHRRGGNLYNVSVLSDFFDVTKKSKKGEVFLYPSPMIKLLYEDDSGSFRSEGDEEIMFHAKPERLSQGDLVFGRFQNGLENGRWFRGRVAAVNELENATPVCDIAYDDGDYEGNVPYRECSVKGDPNVFHCECGGSKNWIMGLDIPIPVMSDNDDVESKYDRVVVVHMNDGKTVTLSYSYVVETLFRKAREDAPRIVSWPSTTV